MTHLLVATVLMFALMLGGVWVAAALGLAGAYGLTELLSFDRMVSIVGKMAWQQSTSFVLVALPLFILMGEMMLQSGIMQRVYNAASKIVAALPGGEPACEIPHAALYDCRVRAFALPCSPSSCAASGKRSSSC